MVFTLRFYRHSDLDLIHILWSMPIKKRNQFIQQCINNFIGHYVPLELTDTDMTLCYQQQELINQVYSTGISLNEEQARLVRNIKTGYKNNAIKNIIRANMQLNGIAAYAKNPDAYQWISAMENAFQNKMQVFYHPEALPDTVESIPEAVPENNIESLPEIPQPSNSVPEMQDNVSKEADIQKENITDEDIDALNADIFSFLSGIGI